MSQICPYCQHEGETAEYLETDKGLESAPICVNEDCNHFEQFIITASATSGRQTE